MATNNAINSNDPFDVKDGGTGNVSLLNHGILVGSGTDPITVIPAGLDGQMLIGVTGADPIFSSSLDGDFSITSSTGVSRFFALYSGFTGAGESAANIVVGGANVGDPVLQLEIVGENTWTMGIDNSDSDNFKISASDTLGTTDAVVISSNDQMNLPLQPAFSVYNNTTRTNVTGNSTAYTIPFDQVEFDVGSNLSSGIFTAPIDGKYFFTYALQISDITTAATVGRMQLDISGTTVDGVVCDYGASQISGTFIYGGTWAGELSAADTVEVVLNIQNEGSDINDVDATVNSRFGGFLMC